MLRYFVAEHWQDVVLLCYRYYCARCPMWRVSVRNNESTKACEDDDATLFSCKTYLRFWAVCPPVRLRWQWSVLSVFTKYLERWNKLRIIKWMWCRWERSWDLWITEINAYVSDNLYNSFYAMISFENWVRV
jgi:hypothetical protein